MDLRSLETFIKVAETKSFSRSAEALGLTQPAISKRIAALESTLDATLFDRVGRSAQLTAAGRTLFPRAKHIEAELNSVKAELENNNKDPVGTITIGTTSCVASTELAPILKQFISAFPDVTVKLHLATTDEILELLDSNSMELAICPLFDSSLPKVSNGLQCVEVWRSSATIAAAITHPLAQAAAAGTVITVKDLRKSKAILPPPGSLASIAINNAIAPDPDELIVSARTSNYSTMKKLAAIEMGWTCLPRNRIDDTVVALDVQGLQLNHSISLIRRRDRTLSRVAEAIIGSLPLNDASVKNFPSRPKNVETPQPPLRSAQA